MKKAVAISIIAVLLIFSVIYYLAFQPLLSILNGYTAKRVCSSYYIAERSLDDIMAQDLVYPATWCSAEIDHDQRIVHSSVKGLARQSAQYRPGFGCTISTFSQKLKPTPTIQEVNNISGIWPYGNSLKDTIHPEIHQQKLSQAINASFGTADKTRAVIVAHRGDIIAERYEEGFDKDTELLGWSMTKSITNNLIGILVKQGKISVDDTRLLENWTDKRSQINLEHLLHMATDLDWNEEYGYLSDVTRMLYLNDQASDYAKEKNIRTEIGTSFIYSSGTTNIISEIIKNTFSSEEAYLRFPHEELFSKLGIKATMELDADNNYIMSSYAYMTARDWAKLGQFWLQNGKWKEEQILPSDWIGYSTTTGHGINAIYGAHFWLNDDSFLYSDVPADMYAARGFQGQHVVVIPSLELIIVRFGLDEGIETFDFNTFISSIIASIEV